MQNNCGSGDRQRLVQGVRQLGVEELGSALLLTVFGTTVRRRPAPAGHLRADHTLGAPADLRWHRR